MEIPYGRGCWRCHLGVPIIALPHTSLCFNCLADWFTGWSDEDVAGWFERNVYRGNDGSGRWSNDGHLSMRAKRFARRLAAAKATFGG